MQDTNRTEFDFQLVHPLTLRFRDRAMERAYTDATEKFRQLQMRLGLLVVGFLYSITSLLDLTLIRGIVQPWFYKLHLAQGLSFILFTWIAFQFVRSKPLLYGIILMSVGTAWVNNFIITFAGETTVFFIEVYFMLIWSWLIGGLPFTLAAKVNLLFYFILQFLLILNPVFSSEAIALHELYLFVSMAMGSLAGYMIEYHKRQSFDNHLKAQNARDQAEEAIRTKNRFFSIISHDLRGPISSMSILFNELYTKPSEITGEMYDVLKVSTKSASFLLDNLLTWSISQKGELEYRPSDFDLHEAVEENLTLVSGQALQKAIRVTASVPNDLYIYADFEMVSTILRNLLNNALKFTPRGGEIYLEAKREGGQIAVEVKDSGVGMSSELKNSLFQWNAKSNRQFGTDSEKGSGLGLILCQEFLRYHGSGISVESEPGQGSTFRFTLPPGEKPHPGETGQSGFDGFGGLRVLLVDDNELHLQIGGLILKELGIQYKTAVNGREALERYQKEEFHLILMDIDMPVMNGVELNLAIRRLDKKPSPLIISLSSNTKADLNRMAEAAPFDGYLEKPLNADKLQMILRKHLSPQVPS